MTLQTKSLTGFFGSSCMIFEAHFCWGEPAKGARLYQLDIAARRGLTPEPAQDFKVTGKYQAAANHPLTIFFDYNAWDASKLDADETAKIQAAAKQFKTTALTLEG